MILAFSTLSIRIPPDFEAFPSEIARIPVHTRQVDRALAFHETDHLTHRILGQDQKQNVNMVGLQMPLHDRTLLLLSQPFEDFVQVLAQFHVQLLAPVLGDKTGTCTPTWSGLSGPTCLS